MEIQLDDTDFIQPSIFSPRQFDSAYEIPQYCKNSFKIIFLIYQMADKGRVWSTPVAKMWGLGTRLF